MNRKQLLAQPKRPLIDPTWIVGPTPKDERCAPTMPDITDVIVEYYVEHRGRLLLFRRLSDGLIFDRQVER